MYKYEMHLHSIEASACALNTAREMVYAFKEAGYAGFVLTNHFIHGNTCISRELPWKERMMAYYDAYLEAKEEGEKYDFDVLFGVEHNYGNGKEVLVYGLDIDAYIRHPEMRSAYIEEFSKIVHAEGGLIYHAHPHRVRSYITPGIPPRYDVCDGIEVFNSGDDMETNHLAYEDAMRCNKLMLSGGDIHESQCARIGQSGIVFPKRIQNNEELVKALQNHDLRIIINGEIKGIK